MLVFVFALLLAGCASSYRVNPSKVDLALVGSASEWEKSNGTVHVPMRVRNNSRAVLEVGVDAAPGVPSGPVQISWLYYRVLTENGRVDLNHGPGGHGPMPPKTLRIGPGESASVIATLYGVSGNDCSRQIRVRIRDLEGNWYTTDTFAPCATP
jgi:hypothetical protein